MQTFILNPDNADSSLKSLLEQVATGDIQICDASGRVLAYLTSPGGHDDPLYAEAEAEFMARRDVVLGRMRTRGGISTEELCRRVGMPYHGERAETE